MQKVARSTKNSAQAAANDGSLGARRTLHAAPDEHARALVEAYGLKGALEIAQMNAALRSTDDYWAQVSVALGRQPQLHDAG